jgi:hypothetical protein
MAWGCRKGHRPGMVYDEEEQRRKAVASVVAMLTARRKRERGNRRSLMQRQHLDWELRLGGLNDRRFFQRYRMDKKTLGNVAETIRYDVEADQVKSSNARGGAPPISAEIMLSATLRFCAGGCYRDIVDLHGIGESTLYEILMQVLSLLYGALACCCRCIAP